MDERVAQEVAQAEGEHASLRNSLRPGGLSSHGFGIEHRLFLSLAGSHGGGAAQQRRRSCWSPAATTRRVCSQRLRRRKHGCQEALHLGLDQAPRPHRLLLVGHRRRRPRQRPLHILPRHWGLHNPPLGAHVLPHAAQQGGAHCV